MWQCESCNILVPARRDRCPKGHGRPAVPPSGRSSADAFPSEPPSPVDLHGLGPLPPPIEVEPVPDATAASGPIGGQAPAPQSAFDQPPPAVAATPQPPVAAERPMPKPPAREEVGGLYFALRLSSAGEPVSSVRYPVLDKGGEPVLWGYEEPSSASSTVDSFGSNVHDRIRRHEGGARVILTNRRLIVVSIAAPGKNKGWQDAWDSEPRPQRSDRLMGHALWEWVSQVQCRAAAAGPSVDVVMSTSEGDSPRFVLSFAARGSSAEQRAQHLASSIAEVAATYKGTEPQRQGSTWFFDGYVPVGEVQ